MKKIRLIFSYYRGNGFSCILLMVVLLGTLLLTTMVSSRIEYMGQKTSTLASYGVEKMYYLQYFPSDEEFFSGRWEGRYNVFSEEIQEMEGVKGLFTVYDAQPFSYNEIRVNVTLYQPNMIKLLLPNSREGDLLSKNSQGAILAGRVFGGLKEGDHISIRSTW